MLVTYSLSFQSSHLHGRSCVLFWKDDAAFHCDVHSVSGEHSPGFGVELLERDVCIPHTMHTVSIRLQFLGGSSQVPSFRCFCLEPVSASVLDPQPTIPAPVPHTCLLFLLAHLPDGLIFGSGGFFPINCACGGFFSFKRIPAIFKI